MKKIFTVSLVTSLALVQACGKKKSDSSDSSATDGSELGDGSQGFAVTGTLQLDALLTAGSKVTHVVALNTENGRKLAFPVDEETGEFRLMIPTSAEDDFTVYINADGTTVDRERLLKQHPDVATEIADLSDEQLIAKIKESAEEDGTSSATPEPSPWTLAYVDATKTGADMMVSRFASETLDTIAPTRGNVGVSMGDVTPVVGGKASTTAAHADILEAISMSADTATTFGAIDDVSLRYINPDIDGDGVLDSPVMAADGSVTGTEVRYVLDFHNRFTINDANGGQVFHTSLKNKFADDVLGGLANVNVAYTGTGIIPELEKSTFSAAPSTYKWKFESALTMPASVCSELPSGGTLAAGSWCTHSYTVNPNYDRYQLGQEVALPPVGKYVLDAGEKVFTWTDVKVSDFSAGMGFVILLVKYNTDDKGTADTSDDVMSSISYKYLKKTATGWTAATEAELKLLIKGTGGHLSLKFDNDALNCGLEIPKTPTGTVDLKTANISSNTTSNAMTTLINELKAGTVTFSRFSSGAASYDDKLGMRFFF
ncbi:MAG TPA: hypothetical protein VFO10_13345 [Oligoflexus sp.]|uniref:hypothetical protein n=1 Tax=Oligoflexus sp. TaxID=1971216 RepID=UPI002D7F8D93|nr:hypothetical protein [Oligoflexus sp.]HET9238239.1 hypothetical protein [Oligoflexus sp.]